jgi:hypothetical protein
MRYTKESPEWSWIRGNTGHWFSKRTLSFFNSTIYWATLTPVGEEFYFATSEWNNDKTGFLFSVRVVDKDFNVDTVGEYREHLTLAAAKAAIKKIKENSNA